jgi:hypothetical protein
MWGGNQSADLLASLPRSDGNGGRMPEIVVFLGQAALVLAALLVVLVLFICVVTLVVHAVRKVRQMYEL